MSKFCGDCAAELQGGSCPTCTAKSTGAIDVDSLEKALDTLESLSKGVRPKDAAEPSVDGRDLEKVTSDARKQVREYGDHGEGETEEEPETEKDVESRVKGKGSSKKVFGKGGFMPPPQEGGEEEEEEDPRRRAEEEEEEEEAAAGGGGRPMPFKSAKGKAKKSMADELMEDDTVRKAIDVSDFLERMTKTIVKSHDALRSDIDDTFAFQNYQQRYNVGLAKALGELGNLVKSLTEVVETLGKSPAGQRKGDVTVVEKSFNGNNTTDNKEQPLTKSAIAEKVLALMEGGDKTITPMDVYRAESTGLVTADIKKKLGL